MLERDQIGATPDGLSRHLPGGVAPARQALARQRYLDEKRLRLAAEAKARRQQAPAIPLRIGAALDRLIATFAARRMRCGATPSDAARK